MQGMIAPTSTHPPLAPQGERFHPPLCHKGYEELLPLIA